MEWNNSLWVGVGSNAAKTTTIGFSNNGIYWTPATNQIMIGNAAMSVKSFLNRITAIAGLTFSGDMLTNTILLKTVIFNKYIFFEYPSRN